MSDQQLLAEQKKKWVPVPISRDQIDKAKEMIKENHPLGDVPLGDAFPLLKPCAKKRAPVADENQPLMHSESETKKVSDVKEGTDPLNLYGFGIIAYRDLMFTFIILFSVISVLMIPAMVFYSGYKAIPDNVIKPYARLSLGNMGYSTTQCTSVMFSLGKIPLSCPTGTSITAVTQFGINTVGASKTSCVADDKSVCHPFLEEEVFKTKIQSQCTGDKAEVCSFDVNEDDLFKDPKTADAKCTAADALLFVQYTCTQSVDEIATKKKQLSIVSCLGVFSCFLFIICVYHLKRDSKLDQLDWDIATITPGDYTAQYEITDTAYEWFLNNVFRKGDEANGISVGASLKAYMRNNIEKLLTDKLNSLRSSGDLEANIKITEVKIADIVFAYDNAELINALKTRGNHIMYQRFDKMREVEAQISKMKDEQYDKLTKPVDAFITFEEEDGLILSQEFEPKYTITGKRLPSKETFMGEELFFTESTEPTNIIWENRHWGPADYFKRGLIAAGIIFVLLSISFVIIYFSKVVSTKIQAQYPAVDCENIKVTYQSGVENTAGYKGLEYYAVLEHKNYYVPEGEEPTPLQGPLQCFCAVVNEPFNFVSTQIAGYDKPICQQFVKDKLRSLAFSKTAQFLIIGVNYILRLFIIKLIIYIGKDTESEQTRLIANGVFIVQFFNTAILLLICNANLAEQGLGFINGRFADFDALWFNDIGSTLVGAMIFNVYWPVAEFFVNFGMRTGFRLLDSKFKCDPYSTKKITLQQYVELYSGPTFFIHYKYSSILNITFVTMMYGIGIPVLFPVAALSLLTLYLIEKLMIYYVYRQPPMYDARLNENVLSILTYAPLLFLSFGYWMISNHQLYSNNTNQIVKSTDIRVTGHHWHQVFQGAFYSATEPGMPLLIMFWVFLFFTVTRNFLYPRLCNWFPNVVKVGELEIDEDLDNYFNTLDDNDRGFLVKEEENARDVLKFKVLDDYTFNRLKTTKMGDAHMQGVPCYDILANPLYLDDFQYFGPAKEDRATFIIDDDSDEDNDNAQSDLVKMALNLAFLTEAEAKAFSFDKNAYSAQVKGLKNVSLQ